MHQMPASAIPSQIRKTPGGCLDQKLSQENLYLLFLTVVVEKTGEWVVSNPRASNSEWGKTRDDS